MPHASLKDKAWIILDCVVIVGPLIRDEFVTQRRKQNDTVIENEAYRRCEVFTDCGNKPYYGD